MMRSRFKQKLVLVGFLILSTVPLFSLDVPPLKGRVQDFAGVLNSGEKAQISNYLTALEQQSGAQIAVLVIKSLEGESLESYAWEVAEEWGLGQKGVDNGALLLVSLNDRAIRIEVGYGLESQITDAVSGFIIRNSIAPDFQRGRYAQGIMKGVQSMGQAVAGELSPQKVQESSQNDGGSGVPAILIFFLISFLFGGLGRYGRYRRRGMSPMSAFILGSMLGSSGSRGHHHSGGGFGGGGGFSGGGGGFGGGGASGGW
ncbi:MAG: TPM domain-containing protein [Spirochaetales bacterium]|nr:TPM domain-containing protein [Spirochaetales bacterium]